MNHSFLLYLGALLFTTGVTVVVTRRNSIMVLLGIELILNAANLNATVFQEISGQQLDGQVFALFVIIVAVCEAAVGMAIVLRIYHYYHTSVPDQVSELKEKQ